MAVDAAQMWTTIGFAVLIAIATLLAFGAYWSLRRMDDVLLKARIYVNRHRLFTGFLAFFLAMAAIMVVVMVSLVYMLAVGDSIPNNSPLNVVTAGVFLASFGLLSWGFFNFYAMSKSPRAEPAAKVEGHS